MNVRACVCVLAKETKGSIGWPLARTRIPRDILLSVTPLDASAVGEPLTQSIYTEYKIWRNRINFKQYMYFSELFYIKVTYL